MCYLASSSCSPFCPPQVAAALARKRGALDGWLRRLQTVDRKLLAAIPILGRYCWETVLTFER